MADLIEINGAFGSGGGQVLRASLALSAALGRPFRIHSIRANRPKPGLMRQHLTCVRAVADICGAQVQGAELHSSELVFVPGAVRPGDYAFEIGTGGSTTLVMQAVVPALAAAARDGAMTVTVTGGTYCPMAPTAEFAAECLAPALGRAGYGVRFEILRHGFAHVGGGKLAAHITPFRPVPLELVEPCRVTEAEATVVNHGLDGEIARREVARIRALLEPALPLRADSPGIIGAGDAPGVGNAVFVRLRHSAGTTVTSAIGAMRTPAESVAENASREALRFARSGNPVCKHLADQLLVPLALGAGGVFRTSRPTPHTRTCAEVIRRFTGQAVEIKQDSGSWLIRVNGRREE